MFPGCTQTTGAALHIPMHLARATRQCRFAPSARTSRFASRRSALAPFFRQSDPVQTRTRLWTFVGFTPEILRGVALRTRPTPGRLVGTFSASEIDGSPTQPMSQPALLIRSLPNRACRFQALKHDRMSLHLSSRVEQRHRSRCPNVLKRVDCGQSELHVVVAQVGRDVLK